MKELDLLILGMMLLQNHMSFQTKRGHQPPPQTNDQQQKTHERQGNETGHAKRPQTFPGEPSNHKKTL